MVRPSEKSPMVSVSKVFDLDFFLEKQLMVI